MIKRIVLSILLFGTMYSCGPNILDDKRQLFETTIKDANGNPINNASVRVATAIYREDRATRASDIDLGTGITDQNGFISIISLTADRDIAIEVQNSASSNNLFIIPQDRWNNDIAVVVPELILKLETVVNIDFVNTTGISNAFAVSIDYQNEFCDQVLIGNNFETDGNCDDFDGLINNGGSDVIQLWTLYPSTFTVSYSINNQLFTEDFILDAPNQSYVINY